MPDKRIEDILTEISATAINPRVRELITELGDILATIARTERDNTTKADERFKTVGIIYRNLRKELRAFERRIEERDHSVAAKIHQLSSHIMHLQQELAQIADAVNVNVEDEFTRAKIVNGDDSDLFSDDDTQTSTT